MKPFNLKEHQDWLEFVKGKQEYDQGSRGQIQNKVCPECGSIEIYLYNVGGGEDKSWFECEKCHYMNNGDKNNIPTFEEYTNENRNKKLKDIL